ncbi:MAG: 7-carboxy-7-deazaguanine synthase QueE [Pseudohongiellaceae bacterium]
MKTKSELRITEIFHSLQGESSTVGRPTVFVRLTGCPLRCRYCDTAYAFSGGETMNLATIVEQVTEYDCPFVTVTGGEPLAQPECIGLLTVLCDRGFAVSLETGGALSIAEVDKRVSVVLDLKTPGSAESHRNREDNIPLLKPADQVKFVICSREDYEWAREKVEQFGLHEKVGEVLFSPSFTQLPARQLAEWVLADRLPVRMQMQLHKLIWGDVPGH